MSSATDTPVSFILENIGGSDPPAIAVAEGRAVEVGRAPTCGASMQNSKISKHHATLRVQAGSLMLADRTSTNGTYLNGHRITAESKVFPGDVIQFSQDPALKFLVTVGKPHAHGCRVSTRSMALLTVTGAASSTLREFGVPDGVRLLGGRSSRANITISDPEVSAIHFAVWGKNGKWSIEPIKPDCRIILRDATLTGPALLTDGDLITVGTTCLRFTLHSAPVAIPGDTDSSHAAALPFDDIGGNAMENKEGGDIWAREALGVGEGISEREILDRFAEASVECTKQIESAPNKVIMDWYLKRQKFLEGARDFLLNRLQSGRTMLISGSCDKTLDEGAMEPGDGTWVTGTNAPGSNGRTAGNCGDGTVNVADHYAFEKLYRLGPAILLVLALIWLGWEIFVAPAQRQKRLEADIEAVSVEAAKAADAGDIEGAAKILRSIDDDRFDEYPSMREKLRQKIFDAIHPGKAGWKGKAGTKQSGKPANP